MKKSKIKNLKKRQRQEKIFQNLGRGAIAFSLVFLALLFGMIITKAYPAFWRSEIALEVNLQDASNLEAIDLRQKVKESLKLKFPEAQTLAEINSLYQIISKIANLELKAQIERSPESLGRKSVFWFSASAKAEMFFSQGDSANLNENQVLWLKNLQNSAQIRQVFNWQFFKFSDSREPEIAGIGASFVGSILVMLIFLILAFPIGVMCAFYLEEFASKNRITDIIEISINNLAAIPSIIYGLLGLTLYLQFMNLPRSSSLVGGMTLFMLVLPVIIIATRNTIRSIPNSIRDGAMGLGASKMQIVLHHLLPLSIPGIMTGTILAVSRALGETAPLLMIGMVAFIADVPAGFSDPTTVLPVQIYLWSDSPEVAFSQKTSAAILVLLGFLIILNLVAIILRKKFERKW